MHQVYLLLRNNKQLGPFSLEELLQQCLQPLDLVWEEGKSAGWQYPPEVASLKNYLQPEEEKIGADESSQKSIASPTPLNRKAAIYVSLPAGKANSEIISKETKDEAFKEKAEALYRRAQDYASGNNAAEDNELETKYCRSLNDLKQDYAEWMREQKKPRKRFNRKHLVRGAAVLSLIALTAFGWNIFSSGEKVLDPELEIRQPVVLHDQRSGETKPVSNSEKKKAAINKKPVTRKNITAKNTAGKKAQKKARPVPVQKRRPAQPVDQLVRITGRYKPVGSGISSAEVTVKNNSKEELRVVAVDVFYYYPDGSGAGKKTIYFNDLEPGASKTLPAPAHQEAEELKFRLGLISSRESGIYYAMQ